MTTTTPDVGTIAETRGFFADLAQACDADVVQIELALAHLVQMDLDQETLDGFQSTQDDALRAAARCRATVATLDVIHGAMEQAVNATPDAAKTDFYRDAGAGPAAGRGNHPTVATSEQPWTPDVSTEQSASAVPFDQRAETLRRYGIDRCPDWCNQDPDEHDYEEHVGAGETYKTAGGADILVRPRAGWHGHARVVELVAPAAAEDGIGLVLDAADLAHLHALAQRMLEQAEDHHDHDDPARTKPAYPGAEATAASTDADARLTEPYDGGMYLGSGCGFDRPYLDWGRIEPDGSRYLKLSDGGGAAEVQLAPADLGRLRDAIANTLRLPGAPAADDPGMAGAYYLDDEAGRYVDFSLTLPDGRFVFELGDNDHAHNLFMSPEQLRELHERLALPIQLDGQDTT